MGPVNRIEHAELEVVGDELLSLGLLAGSASSCRERARGRGSWASLPVAVHGVTFEEASEVFASGAVVYETYDAEHSESEDRFRTLGLIQRGLVLVVWTERTGDVVRIISARFATRSEQDLYNEYVGGKP